MDITTRRNNFFNMIAHRITTILGSYRAFLWAAAIVAAWLAIGPFMRFSAEWQSIISCVTGIVTFFMVIFIQHTQNHAVKALHLKLDELIRATERARNKLVELEQLTDAELDELKREFERIRDEALRREERKKIEMVAA